MINEWRNFVGDSGFISRMFLSVGFSRAEKALLGGGSSSSPRQRSVESVVLPSRDLGSGLSLPRHANTCLGFSGGAGKGIRRRREAVDLKVLELALLGTDLY